MVAELLIEAFADIRELQRNLSKVVTIGKIKTVNLNNSTVTVTIKKQTDGTDLVTPAMKWLSPHLGNGGMIWSNPEVGDRVLVVSLTGNLSVAYAIPLVVLNDDRPTDYANANKTHMIFGNNKSIIVDQNDLIIKNGDLEVRVEDDKIVIDGGGIANLTVDGTSIVADATTASVTVDATGVAVTGAAFTWGGLTVDTIGP